MAAGDLIALGIGSPAGIRAFILVGLSAGGEVPGVPGTSATPVLSRGIGPGILLAPTVIPPPRRIPLQGAPVWGEYVGPVGRLARRGEVRGGTAMLAFRSAGLVRLATMARADGALVVYHAAPAEARLITTVERHFREEKDLLVLGFL